MNQVINMERGRQRRGTAGTDLGQTLPVIQKQALPPKSGSEASNIFTVYGLSFH